MADKPSYDNLRELLLYLDSEDDDGRPVPQVWLEMLEKARLLHKGGNGRLERTALAEQVVERLEAGIESPEIRGIFERP